MVKKAFRFLNKNKKTVIVIACIAIISTAVYVDWRIGSNVADKNYLYTSGISDSSKILGQAKFVDNLTPSGIPLDESIQTSIDPYFSNAQITRRQARDESVEMLQTVVDSSETMPDVKDRALQEMMTIASEISKEASIEQLIKAKGFEDCIAVISGDNINVVVKTNGLLANEVAQIHEIIMTESGFSADKIKLIEKS